MGLRPTHLGYAYQDLLTAIQLVDLILGIATTVVVDTKARKGDRFDDITREWTGGRRERLQIKHTAHERPLTPDSFAKDRRSLQLDAIITSAEQDLQQHPGTLYRIVLRDTEPNEPELALVLQHVDPSADPGPVLYGLASARMRFNVDRLLATQPWQAMLSHLSEHVVRRVCDVLVVDVGLPHCSLDIHSPGPAEQALLRRVSDELGAGRPPNHHRSPEEVALSLIEAAKRARSGKGTVLARDLIPRLDLAVDFGAVHEGHPVDRTIAIARPSALDTVVRALDDHVGAGGTVVVTGGPGSGKSWLCEQLADQLRADGWIVARHHCWLGVTDTHRNQRVLAEVVIGSLLRQLEAAAPAAVAKVRPRFAATRETLTAAVAAARNAEPERRIVLIVDGLDHVTRVLGHTQGASFSNPRDPAALLVEELAAVELLPGAVLLIASQPGIHLADVRGGTVPLPSLGRSEIVDLADRLGLVRALKSDATREGNSHDTATAIDLVYARSRGNALYATYLCRQALGPAPALQSGMSSAVSQVDPLARLREVPDTADDLDAYYRYLIDGLTDGQRFAVSLLAVCDFAVTIDELREIFPQLRFLSSPLATVAPIIVQQPGVGGLRIHHESFSRFVLGQSDGAGVAEVRSAAVAWLTERGFFVDLRAFRHLPELLVALDRDDDLSSLIGPDFVARAIAGLQPPKAIAHVLNLVARNAAARRDWPLLIRCVELRRAADVYETEGIPDSIVDYASVLVALLGAEAVSASLIYDGEPTVQARWGLHLCAAVDVAGAAAPWETYLNAWEDPDGRDNVHYGSDRDAALRLVVQRGYIRLPNRRRNRSGYRKPDEQSFDSTVQRLATHLGQDGLPPLSGLLDLFIDSLGAPMVLEAARMIVNPHRRAGILLHLADVSATSGHDLPPAYDLALEAWDCSPGIEPLRMLRHGVSASTVVDTVLGADFDAALREQTIEVVRETGADRPVAVERWLTALALAHAVDRQAPLRLLPQLDGVGFYRAWLRFAATTVGLRRDVATRVVGTEAASATVRLALDSLAQKADLFTGRPRACDLWSIHGLVHEVLEEGIALLAEPDLDEAVNSLIAISNGTTSSTMGMAGSGPLTMAALLTILSRTVDQTGAAVVQRLMDRLRTKRESSSFHYSEYAAFELEMARISMTAGDRDEAQRCWERAARYMACYGGHKDVTLLELLNPLPDLAAIDVMAARLRLADVQNLTYLVAHHTDGRETAHMPREWWRLLADLHPEAAGVLAAQLLLTEPGLEDTRADNAHRRLLESQASDADPAVLAALRIAAGPGGRNLDCDVALLDRLAALPADDTARETHVLPVLANAITSTYDDQPLLYASDNAKGPEPSVALNDAAVRIGGDGGPPRKSRPVAEQSSRWSRPRQRTISQTLHATQRPDLPPGAAGIMSAVRDYLSKQYDDDVTSPRWHRDAFVNAVGWRLVQITTDEGQDVAIRLLHRITEGFHGLGDSEVLADIAEGLDLRRALNHDLFDRLTSTACILAFTKIRGGGGWLAFAGRSRLDLWSRAATIDPQTATTTLADQVVAATEGRFHGNYGVTQAIVAAFASHNPDPTRPRAETAYACWDQAAAVIAYRLPGKVHVGSDVYRPTESLPAGGNINVALSQLALATIAMPERADRRRALVAATILLAARPTIAQAAAAFVLAADIGAGPLTWLLSVLRHGLRGTKLAEPLADQLVILARSDFLSVRATAADILKRAGRQAPAPPATPAHPAILEAVAEALDQEPQ